MTSPFESMHTGYSMPLPRTRSSIFSPPSGRQTPMITSPWSAYLRASSLALGMLAMHGPHQVAQKSSTTTLPRSSFRVAALPMVAAVLVHWVTNASSGASGHWSNLATWPRRRPSPSSIARGSGSTRAAAGGFSASTAGLASEGDFFFSGFDAGLASPPSTGTFSASSFSATARTCCGCRPIARSVPLRSITP